MLLTFLFLSINYFHAQTLTGTVKDTLTQMPLAFSNIVLMNGGGTYTNGNGAFELSIKNTFDDTLKVSIIGYKSKLIPLFQYRNTEKPHLDIQLEPLVDVLDEVIISGNKINYRDKETLGEKRNGNIGVTSLIGYETCIFIENPRKKTAKVKRVYIDLKKRKDADHIAALDIRLYELDRETMKPGKALHNKRIFIKPKNKKYRLWINVESYNIKLPSEGICLGVEMVNTVGKVEKYTYFGPIFRYTFSQNNKLITWSNYHNSGWRGGSIAHNRYKRYKTGISNPMFGIEVLYPKE